MGNFYIFIVAVLFLLAISDLIIGVSNDAVNFLNSAIGSKAAPFRIIMLVAAVGVLVGATFSGGMMEVARKGIMHPEPFFFSEIMIIFLAVMLTDIILLDLYNTFGLPTSTTVSIVFELLGASVALAIIKMRHMGQEVSEMGTYINSSKALAIISGILISVVVAFIVGAFVQYLTRMLFTFKIEKTYRRYGGIFGGLAISFIIYFMLIKGAKGATFMSEDAVHWIMDNTWMILLFSFIGWSIILQLLVLFTKVNIFKIIVLVGTFSLAMAFAGNDLVNFIGVPLAGFESLKTYLASPDVGPDALNMIALQGPIKTPAGFLLAAGLIMVGTLYLSRKAKSVTKTTIDLSRQDVGHERFESTGFSRAIVRHTRTINEATRKVVPNRLLHAVERRFDREGLPKSKEKSSFDLIRASVNLLVAAVLIAFGTSLKLPLSTTYVTFMVAMGTSLSDRAWGRESAVYRITGVVVVIAGWFVTAFLAFTCAFLMATFLHWAGFIGIIALIALAIFMVIRSQFVHRRRQKKEVQDEEAGNIFIDPSHTIFESSAIAIGRFLTQTSAQYNELIDGLIKEDRKQLKQALKEIENLNINAKELKDAIPKTIAAWTEESIESSHYYVQVLDYLREIAHCLTYIGQPIHKHVDNNHKPMIEVQQEELHDLTSKLDLYLKDIGQTMASHSYDRIDEIQEQQAALLLTLTNYRKKQLKRIKRELVGTRNSMLYFNLLQESKNLVLFALNLLKSQRDLTIHSK